MDNTNNSNDKNQYLEDAKVKLAEMKGKWEEMVAMGKMNDKQAEMEASMSDLQQKIDNMKDSADDAWENTKTDWDQAVESMKTKLGM